MLGTVTMATKNSEYWCNNYSIMLMLSIHGINMAWEWIEDVMALLPLCVMKELSMDLQHLGLTGTQHML